jgi:hypothetical protein
LNHCASKTLNLTRVSQNFLSNPFQADLAGVSKEAELGLDFVCHALE